MLGLGISALGVSAVLSDTAAAIKAIFASAPSGLWYEPSDMSTLFQDSAGTTPVTAVGQPVGRVLDKSGRGNHATQPTSTARPTLQIDGSGNYYLRPDGIDDSMITPAINLTGKQKLTICVGVKKLGNSFNSLIETTPAYNTAGGFAVFASSVGIPDYGLGLGDSGLTFDRTSSTGFPSSFVNVVTGIFDTTQSTALTRLVTRVDGIQAVSTAASLTFTQGATFGNVPLCLFSRNSASAYFNGNFYGLIIIGETAKPAQLAAIERYMAGRTGVTLP